MPIKKKKKEIIANAGQLAKIGGRNVKVKSVGGKSPEQARKEGILFDTPTAEREKLTAKLGGGKEARAQANQILTEQRIKDFEAEQKLKQEMDIQAAQNARIAEVNQLENNPSQNVIQPDLPEGALGQTPAETATSAGLNIGSAFGGAAGGAAVAGTAIGALGLTLAPLTLGASLIAAGLIGGAATLTLKLASDRKQATKEAIGVYNTATGNRYKTALNMANQPDLYTVAEVNDYYETNLANIYAAQAELDRQVRTKVGKALSDAQEEKNKVDTWLRDEPKYRAEVYRALRNPDPNKILPLTPEGETLTNG